jgi:hypothetical protein
MHISYFAVAVFKQRNVSHIILGKTKSTVSVVNLHDKWRKNNAMPCFYLLSCILAMKVERTHHADNWF